MYNDCDNKEFVALYFMGLVLLYDNRKIAWKKISKIPTLSSTMKNELLKRRFTIKQNFVEIEDILVFPESMFHIQVITFRL